MKLSTKQKKLAIIGTVSAVVLLSGGVGYSVVKSNEYKDTLSKVRTELSQDSTQITELQKRIASFYTNNNKEYLKESLTDSEFKSLQEAVNNLTTSDKALSDMLSKLKDKDKNEYDSDYSVVTNRLKSLHKDFEELSSKYTKQTTLNKLFSKRVLVGDKLTEQPIADKLSNSEFNKAKSTLYVKDAKSAFDKSVNEGLSFAEKQLKQIDDTKSKEAELVKNGKATDKANKDSLSQFKALVEGIKNPNIKKSFDKALKAISDKVTADEKAKEAKAKADAEAKAKEVGGNVEKQDDGTYVVKANDGTEYKATGNGQVTEVPRTQTSSSNASNSGGTQSQASTPSQPTSNSGGSVQTQPSTPAPQPSQPSNPQPTQPSTSTPAPAPQPSAPTIVSGYIGNTGRLWDNGTEANEWGAEQIMSMSMQDGKSHRWVLITIFYSDGSKKYSVDLY